MENLAVVTLSFKDPLVLSVIKDLKTPVISFVSTMGGILGICAGMSFISCFEAIEAWTEAAVLFIKKKRSDHTPPDNFLTV